MNKRIIVALTVIAVLLSGCQLARPDAGESAQQDRLIGVFITTDHINAIDGNINTIIEDAWTGKNIDSTTVDKIFTSTAEAMSEVKLFAKMEEKTAERSDGTSITTQTFRFEGIEGMVLAAYWVSWKDASGTEVEGYWTNETGEGLSDVHVRYNTADTGNSVQMDASIFVTGDSEDYCFYLNPIYRNADGQVYLMPGTGASFGTAVAGQLDLELSAEAEYSVNGDETTDATDIHVTIDLVEVAQEIILIQMDENNVEICRNSYLPGKLPEEIQPGNDTAYVLVEEHCADTVNRRICQRDSDKLEVFYSLENGICIKDSAAVKWQDAK